MRQRENRALYVAAVAVALASGHAMSHALILAGPIGLIVAILAELATGWVLLAFRHTPASAARQLLAALYVGAALSSTALLACIPLLPGDDSLVAVPASTASWLAVLALLHLAIGAIAYARVRRLSEEQTPFAGHTFAPGLVALALALLEIAGAVRFSAALPALRTGAQFSGLYLLVTAPSLVLLLLVSSVCVRRSRHAHEVDRAFSAALLVTACCVLVTAVAERFAGSWPLALLGVAFAALYVLGTTIRRLLYARKRLRAVESDLAHVESEAHRHADRTRALWQIVSSNDDHDLLTAVLENGSSALRPGIRMAGYIAHLEGEDVAIDAVTGSERAGGELRIATGERYPLEDTMAKLLYAENRTLAWNDITTFGAGEGRTLCLRLGWKSFIGTPLHIGRNEYFLAFGCPDVMQESPFDEDDIAFVDVLASFLARQFYDAQQRERIQFQIEHDALTGLKNRTFFRTTLRAAIAARQQFTVAVIDLDRFREINEVAGNMIGDELLVEVATELDDVDARDFIARTSGDGFAIILFGAISIEDVAVRMAAYTNVFRSQFHTGDRDGTRMLSVTASIGVAQFPSHGSTAEDLLRATDLALDAAKLRGGSSVVLFDSNMMSTVTRHHLRSAELADAITNDELEVVYQPTFSLVDLSITGAEALVRWNHPTRGQLLPSEFVPFAERNGLIAELSRWVIDRVIADLRLLPFVPDDFRCYFNLASPQLDDLGFISEIEQRLRFVPHLAKRLGVEITETAAIANAASSMYALEQFHRLGLRVAIDDFGTGFSSLSYLKRLPIDVIKIDRAFIFGLPDDDKDAALCELLLQIAKRFKIVALAEGIETYAQLQWLRDRGCAFGQGFLVSRPLPFVSLQALLRRPDQPVSPTEPVRRGS